MMQKSESIAKLAEALCKAQKTMRYAVKTADNPDFKSKYADLSAIWEVCRDALTSNGLSVSQLPAADGAKVAVTTALLHQSGEWLLGTLTMTAKDSSPHSIGSCITYARRYSLAAMLGIVADEDDDGNEATHNKPPDIHSVATNSGPTEPQLRRLGALQHSARWTDEELKQYCRTKYNVVTRKDLTRVQYDDVCNHLIKVAEINSDLSS